jgi:hypothetical protein
MTDVEGSHAGAYLPVFILYPPVLDRHRKAVEVDDLRTELHVTIEEGSVFRLAVLRHLWTPRIGMAPWNVGRRRAQVDDAK